MAVIFTSSSSGRRSGAPLCSVGLEGHFGFAVEQVHALLIELEPDLLVGRDGNARRHADVDDRRRTGTPARR